MVTQKLVNVPLQVQDDQDSITSNCYAIAFQNYGQRSAEIYVNDTVHAHSGNEYLYLPPGGYIVLGNDSKYKVQDTFDVVFTGTGTKGMNVIKQYTERIED